MRPATSLIGRQQRQRPGAVAHRLVRNAGHLVRQQRIGQFQHRSQVQVGEQHQPLAEVPVLLLDRLLHLHHHLGQPPDIVRRADDLRAGGLVLVVGQRGKLARVVLHQHRMSCCHQCMHTGRRHADPAFVVFHFLRYANNHVPHPTKPALIVSSSLNVARDDHPGKWHRVSPRQAVTRQAVQ